MENTQKMANQLEQMEIIMDGMLDRLGRMEELCAQLKTSRPKPKVFINEDTAILSSNEADIEWVQSHGGKIDELPNMRNKHIY